MRTKGVSYVWVFMFLLSVMNVIGLENHNGYGFEVLLLVLPKRLMCIQS